MTQLIDNVARGMTDAAPPALRGAVLARIARRRPTRVRWSAVPIAAAALIALAIVLRNAGTNPNVAPPVPAIAQNAPAAGGGSPAAMSDDSATPARGAIRSRPRAAPLSLVRTIPALTQPVALAGVSIQPDALDIPLLQLKPIVTEPIAIKVISDDSGGRE